MRRFLFIPLLACALALSACAGSVQKAGNIVGAVTQTVVNPLGEVDIYRVKNVYTAGLQLAADYRKYCWSKSYAALMADPIARPVCQNRRPNVRAMQAAKNIASNAIRVAERFIRNNPSGNAVSYVNAAWNAVQDFRAAIPSVQ